MSLKKRMNKSLILGLITSSVFVSGYNVYALNEDSTKETAKVDNKIELNVDENQEITTLQKEIVKAHGLNIRKEDSMESDIVGYLKKNDIVTVLETEGDWSKIQLSNDEEGWVNNKYTDNEKAKVDTWKLNLRVEPSTEKEVIEKLDKNTELEILNVVEIENKEDNSTQTWYEVKVLENEDLDNVKSEEANQDDKENKEEKIGFVHADYILTESKEAKLQEEAKKNEQIRISAKKQGDKVVQSNQVVSSSNLSGRTITVNASAYSGDGITSTGTKPKWGTIAVDPKVIPYGTKVYIPMYNKVFIAEDCGGAIKGNKIDIYMNSTQECLNFGRRNIEIKILG